MKRGWMRGIVESWFRIGVAALFCCAALTISQSSEAQTRVRVVLDSRFDGQAGILLHALDRGYFRAENLDVTIEQGSGARDAIAKLAAGTFDLAIADVNALIRFRDQNPEAQLRAVMMLHDMPAYAIVGRKSRGISQDLSSLEGKKIGAPAQSRSFAQWPIVRAVNKLSDRGIIFENIGLPVREPMLASGEVDAIFGYAFTSYVNMKARGTPEADLITIYLAHHGLALYGEAIIAHPKFAAEQPEAIKGLLRATIRAIHDLSANPVPGAEAVVRRNDVARKEVEAERLAMVIAQNIITPWTRVNGIGGIDATRWANALAQIELAYKFRDKAKAGDAFTDAFLPPQADRMPQ